MGQPSNRAVRNLFSIHFKVLFFVVGCLDIERPAATVPPEAFHGWSKPPATSPRVHSLPKANKPRFCLAIAPDQPRAFFLFVSGSSISSLRYPIQPLFAKSQNPIPFSLSLTTMAAINPTPEYVAHLLSMAHSPNELSSKGFVLKPLSPAELLKKARCDKCNKREKRITSVLVTFLAHMADRRVPFHKVPRNPSLGSPRPVPKIRFQRTV